MLPQRTKTSSKSPRSISDLGLTFSDVRYVWKGVAFYGKLFALKTLSFLRSTGARFLLGCLKWFASLVVESVRVFLALIMGFLAAVYVLLTSFDVWFPLLIRILKFMAKILAHAVRFLL